MESNQDCSRHRSFAAPSVNNGWIYYPVLGVIRSATSHLVLVDDGRNFAAEGSQIFCLFRVDISC